MKVKKSEVCSLGLGKTHGVSCGPSAAWPARQTAAREKRPATPIGMTWLGYGGGNMDVKEIE